MLEVSAVIGIGLVLLTVIGVFSVPQGNTPMEGYDGWPPTS